MFYDHAKIYVKGGDGGNGCVAFRREKYVPEGGPWGGDGGRGGNIILCGSRGLQTLVDFKYKKHYKAERGQHGQGKTMHGKAGEDLVLSVPVGTIVKNAGAGEIYTDILEEGQEVVVSRGGRGGRGNARFSSSRNSTPSFAEKGEPGEDCWLELELKLLADVALIGFPNVGKSTIISHISAAKPKVASYHFTTLKPNLGVVKIEDTAFVVADIPGLIEGAHKGVGLGHRFLRHTERTRLLVHIIDASGSEGRDPLNDISIINNELKQYSPQLARRPQVIAANKMDIPGAGETVQLLKEELKGEYEIFPVSAVTGEGLDDLVYKVLEMLHEIPEELPEVQEEKEEVTHRYQPRFTIDKKDGVFVVQGKEIEKHVSMTDLENEEALHRLQRIMKVIGLENALRDAGAVNGALVRIGDFEFHFVE
ncbi:MAG: GTPase ObgE [Clostridiales bacterium]|nr:GTPase ObgE [Clostridiales bacterium]MCF8021493.1 GTPase ObgE [Clostridiales bacterium]